MMVKALTDAIMGCREGNENRPPEPLRSGGIHQIVREAESGTMRQGNSIPNQEN